MASTQDSDSSWRVKLYQLSSDGQWDDKGTGQLVCRTTAQGRVVLDMERKKVKIDDQVKAWDRSGDGNVSKGEFARKADLVKAGGHSGSPSSAHPPAT